MLSLLLFEYASPVWHYSITCAQTEQLETIQKRAVHIIFNFTRGMSYPNLLFVTNLNSLKDRRDKVSRTFFQKMSNPASCLHHLLPPRHDTSVTSRLRSCTPPSPNFTNKKVSVIHKLCPQLVPITYIIITPVVSLFFPLWTICTYVPVLLCTY